MILFFVRQLIILFANIKKGRKKINLLRLFYNVFLHIISAQSS